MKVEPFTIEAHMQHLCKWLYLREAYIPSKDEMPKIGFIAYSDNRPIAAAFLRQMEGGHAQIDGLTSNPEATSAERHEALDAVIKETVESAKSLKIKVLMAWTRDEYTLKRGVSNGFTPLSNIAVMAMDLSKGA